MYTLEQRERFMSRMREVLASFSPENLYLKSILTSACELLEQSEFGDKSAEVTMAVSVSPDSETQEGKAIFFTLTALTIVLGKAGTLSVSPFSVRGENRVAVLKFCKFDPK